MNQLAMTSRALSRLILWPMFVIAAGFALTGASSAVSARVMSFNIAAGADDLDGIAAIIRAPGADVVTLQEVDVHWSERSHFADPAAHHGQDSWYEAAAGPPR